MKANNPKARLETAPLVVSVGHSGFLRGRCEYRQQENGIQNVIMVPENSGAPLQMSLSNDTAARFPRQRCEGCTSEMCKTTINAAQIFNAKHKEALLYESFQFLRVESHGFNLNVC